MARSRGLVLAAYLVTLLNNAFIIAPSPLYPVLLRDLGITNAQAGGLVSAFLLTIMLAQLPAGYVIDRVDNRRLITAAVLLLAASSVVPALLPRYEVLLAHRLLAGALTAFIFVPLGNLVTRGYYPDHARHLGLFLAGPPSGMAVGLFLTPAVSAALGWPLALSAFALLMPATLVPFLLVSAGVPERRARFALRRFLALFRDRDLWTVGLAFACTYSGYIYYVSWMPAFVAEEVGATALVAGGLGALVPATGILARPLGGWSVAGPFRRDRRVPVVLGLLGVAGISAAAAVLPPAVAVLLLPAAGFLAQLPFSVYYVFGRDILPAEFSGTALSFLNATSLIGGTLTPYAAGYAQDVTGGFAAAFLLLVGISLAGLVLIASLRRR